jgi:hypothetical protein
MRKFLGKMIGLCVAALVGCGPEATLAPSQEAEPALGQQEQAVRNATDVSEGGPVSRNSDGRLQFFVRGYDNAIYTTYETSVGGSWSGYQSLGGSLSSNAEVARNADGRLQIFAVSGNTVFTNYQVAPNSSAWSGWISLGCCAATGSKVSVARNTDGRLQIFIRATDNQLYHQFQTSPNAFASWSGWMGLGGGLTGNPVAMLGASGRIEVYVRGNDTAVKHIWQLVSNGTTSWSSWFDLGGGINGDPSATLNKDGRTEIFVRGTNGTIFRKYQTRPSEGPWSNWISMDLVMGSDPVAMRYLDGRIGVFARNTSNVYYHNAQQSPGTVWPETSWYWWFDFGGSYTSTPAIIGTESGAMMLFGRGADGQLYRKLQGSTWTNWTLVTAGGFHNF